MHPPPRVRDVPTDQQFRRLLSRHAEMAESAASEATSLARQLRAEAERRLSEAAHQPPESAHRLQATGRAAILRAEQLLHLAECERLTATAADKVLGESLSDPG